MRYGRKTQVTIFRKRRTFANFFIWRDKLDLFEAFDREKKLGLKIFFLRNEHYWVLDGGKTIYAKNLTFKLR